MLFAKTAAPQAALVGLPHPILAQAAESRLTVFTAPAGFLCGGHLAATLNNQARPIVWLRLGSEDADPATFLLSLIGGARRLNPEAGTATLEQMRREPGPTAGWPPLFACLGHELADALPASTAVVLEHVHQLAEAHETLELLGAHLLPALATSMACILTTHIKISAAHWPAYTIHRGAADLRVNAHSASKLVACTLPGWPAGCIERAVTLTEGRADVLAGLCAAAGESAAAPVQHVIERATGLDDLLFRVTCAWLASVNAEASQVLALAGHLDYSHPLLVQATLGDVTLPAGPLLQALGDNWTRVPCVWRPSLRAALRASGSPGYATLHRLADYLASHDALDQAVPLYCEIGDTASAAQAIAGAAETLISLGQWHTLSNWLDLLTKQAPQVAGRHGPARLTTLWNRLVGALDPRHLPPAAVAPAEWYSPPVRAISPHITETVTEASQSLAEGLSGNAAEEGLPAVAPAASLGTVPTADAQLIVPATAAASEAPTQAPLTSPVGELTPAPVEPLALTDDLMIQVPPPAASDNAQELVSRGEARPALPKMDWTPEEAAQALLTNQPDRTAAPDQTPTLTAHLLGTFRISVSDRPVEVWPSGRGQAVFKYLLIHHDQPALRDVLMDVFWPDASPEAARNRLHVALYSIRQKLRGVTDKPVVIFEDGAYRLAPDWRLWLDVDEFERHVEKGGRIEAAGQTAKAAAEYELAVSLYQGDLLADDPYEEWPVLMREHLRVAYLDTLDRTSHIYFSRRQYAACAAMCQLILTRDNCREDTHCLLMCCYSRQGQHHLALRQYQACVEALRNELDVEPAPATRQLADHIRRHERI